MWPPHHPTTPSSNRGTENQSRSVFITASAESWKRAFSSTCRWWVWYPIHIDQTTKRGGWQSDEDRKKRQHQGKNGCWTEMIEICIHQRASSFRFCNCWESGWVKTEESRKSNETCDVEMDSPTDFFFLSLSFWGYVVRRWKNCVWTTLGTIRDYYWKLSEYMVQVAMANGYLHMDMDSVSTVWRSWDW